MLVWGYEKDARRLIVPLLDFTRKGLEFHQAGFKLNDVSRYFWQTRDVAAIKALRPRWEKEAERLETLAPRQLLHAAALSFTHPVTGVTLSLTSEWPDDLRPALAEAAGGGAANLLAQPNPLQYLGFFASDD